MLLYVGEYHPRKSALKIGFWILDFGHTRCTRRGSSRTRTASTAVPVEQPTVGAQQALQCLLCNTRHVAQQARRCLLCTYRRLHNRHCSACCANNQFAQQALQCLLCKPPICTTGTAVPVVQTGWLHHIHCSHGGFVNCPGGGASGVAEIENPESNFQCTLAGMVFLVWVIVGVIGNKPVRKTTRAPPLKILLAVSRPLMFVLATLGHSRRPPSTDIATESDTDIATRPPPLLLTGTAITTTAMPVNAKQSNEAIVTPAKLQRKNTCYN